jgi:hypothetical protein
MNGLEGDVMRVKVNRDLCQKGLALCERCLGQFLKYPMGYERICFTELEDDGSDLLTIELHSGNNDTVLVLDEEQRQLLAGEGWANFVEFGVPMYRDRQPEQ